MSENYMDMKRLMMILMAAALVALPTMAQQEEWQSTSAMKGSGSVYAPQVTGVGAVGVDNLATTTTTETYSPGNSGGPRKVKMGDFDSSTEGGEGDDGSPIGDGLLPLMVMAVAFCGVVYFRRRKAVKG